VAIIEPSPVSGVCIAGAADGLASDRRGVLLTVTTADCVPVYILDPESRAFALLHAGWRGAAAGVVEAGIRALKALNGGTSAELSVHLGPAICGDCYEVGPEVLREFGHPGTDSGSFDLRAWLMEETVRLGVPVGAISTSSWCTRCSADLLHSHRASGGTAGRMAAFLGWRVRGN
jgi:YfiH family protein